MSVESNVVFALALLYFALSCRFLDQSEEKPKPIVTCLHAFPALDKLLDLAQFLIGSFLRHSFENRSIYNCTVLFSLRV